ncbi:uncharacterized protein GGS22DRAFT_112622 [Annulohypoxylon maeteangense]|uniref:uncharacterized protein n=1 Tax=Annulohypoxylon maeteangense TaxID=1927788 RepID=UPI0020075D8F|nr:uncharacterized protein GGS22DRAFT_112622 [Annulohypoxylon maeteangense]KAI0887658.1 hypothetical protein GGS22DRAFT_112622 [Annulohypoxylon maeteangense]
MNRLFTTIAGVATALSLLGLVDGSPKAARWSNKTLGPDGPWNAVEVSLGSGQQVTAYAGKMWESFFPGGTYCGNVTADGQPCYAQEAGGIYSELTGTGHKPSILIAGGSSLTPNQVSNGSDGLRWADSFFLGTNTTPWADDKVNDFDMVLLSDSQFRYPNGNKCPIFAGCLSFGAAPGMVNQTFQVNAGTAAGAVNVSLLAGTLYEENAIDSQTFGMHIGSAAPQPVPGSLWFGGYDRNRAVNDMLAIPIADPYLVFTDAPLVDISINVVKGGSPFPWSYKGGLLASGNSSIGDRLPLAIDPCFPYINLPKSTCDAIAAEIPVTYNEGLGLYLWDTESPDYGRVVRSPSVLSFTFMDPNNNSRRVNISVPFMHLNLTLDKPIVDKPTSYFPCNAVSNGNYALGRAFLQDAFFGANLKTAFYFISQAPGPSVNGQSVTIMDDQCRTLLTSNNNWETSWDGYWTPLPEPADDATNGSSEHMSRTGVIAGSTVGGVAGFTILALIGIIVRRYRVYGKGFSICGIPLIKDKPAAYYGTNVTEALGESPKSPAEYWPQQHAPVPELPTNSGNTWQMPAHVTDQATEMETPYVVHEMPADYLGANSHHYHTRE